MYTLLFIKGFIIGFSIAMPVGPIGVICIQNTLTKGRLHGFIAGIGAALADTFYGIIAALGITAVADFITAHELTIKTLAAAFLFFLGLRMFHSSHLGRIPVTPKQHGLVKTFTSTFFLTLANPLTILAFGAVFAAFGLSHENSSVCTQCFVIPGVICGATTWWLLLSFGAAFIGKRMVGAPTRVLSRVSGMILMSFAFIAVFSVVQDLTGIQIFNISLKDALEANQETP